MRNRKIVILGMGAGIVVFAVHAAAQTARTSTTEIERHVDALVSQMTLDEKIDLIGGVPNFGTRSHASEPPAEMLR